MKISAKTDYACRALLELSLHWPNEVPLHIGVIAERQGIPMKFLTQILVLLKQLGYVQSVRGKSGGYLLTREPQAINLGDFLKSFDSGAYAAYNRENSKSEHVMDLIWGEINATVVEAMEKINFEIICQRKRDQDNVVMFNI